MRTRARSSAEAAQRSAAGLCPLTNADLLALLECAIAKPAPASRRARARGRKAAPLNAEGLPPDMLRAIALSHKGAGADIFVRMLQTCRSWRSALLTNEDGIWKELAFARFPSLPSILSLQYTTKTFREIYLQQLRGSHAQVMRDLSAAPPDADLSSYVFSFELRCGAELIGESSCVGWPCSEASDDSVLLNVHPGLRQSSLWCALTSGKIKAEDDGGDDDGPDVRLHMFVTRRMDMSTIELIAGAFVSGPALESPEGDQPAVRCYFFRDLSLPCRPPLMLGTEPANAEGAVEGVAGFDFSGWFEVPAQSYEEAREVQPHNMRIVVGGSFNLVFDHEHVSLDDKHATDIDLKRYLSHYAPWPAAGATTTSPAPVEPRAPSSLPDGWKEELTRDGRTYYTKKQWERPGYQSKILGPLPLPFGWYEFTAKGGKPYYVMSQWAHPTADMAVLAPRALPTGWSEAKAACGTPYFFRSGSSESQWAPPTQDADAVGPVAA